VFVSPFPYLALLGDAVRARGAARTAWDLLGGVTAIALDSLPWRRRLRYGDIDFDCDRRVNTTWANVGLRTRIRELFVGRGYQPTDPFIFHEMMQRLPADPGALVFLDLGSGKGRALLLAADYPFRRIIGVELLPELDAIARENIAGYRARSQQCSAFELHCADARHFAIPDEPLFLYLFDPFPEEILREVAAKVESSFRRRPRPLFVGYQNPVSEHVFAAVPIFARVEGTSQWAIYRAQWPLFKPFKSA
jgi:SAM-dependent methyltransferase